VGGTGCRRACNGNEKVRRKRKRNIIRSWTSLTEDATERELVRSTAHYVSAEGVVHKINKQS